jgi:hypothetical protein
MAGFTHTISGYENRQRKAIFDLSHGRFLRIDLLDASVSEADGRFDPGHATLAVKFRGCSWGLGLIGFQEYPLNSVKILQESFMPTFYFDRKDAFRSGTELDCSFLLSRMQSSTAKSLHSG